MSTTNETWEYLAQRGNVSELKRIRTRVHDDARAILERAKDERRNLTDSEEKTFESLSSQLDNLTRHVEHAEQKRTTSERENSRYGSTGETPSYEWRSFLNGDSVRIEADYGRSVARRISRKSNSEQRDLVTTSGLNSVPTRVLEEIVLRLVTESAVLQASPRTLNTASGENIKVPTFTSYGTASFVAEGSAFPENDPSSSAVTLGAYKAGRLLQVSDELIMDTGFNIEEFLAQELGVSIGQAVASAVDGTNIGSTAIQGAFSTACLVGATGTAASGAPTVGDVFDLFYSVNPRYQANGSWLMNPATLQHLSEQNDTTGRSLLVPSLSQNTPTTLLGRPVYTSTSVATYGSAVSSVIFGDISRFYTVRFAGGLKLVASRDYALNTGLVTYRIESRVDGRIVDTSAAKRFVGAS